MTYKKTRPDDIDRLVSRRLKMTRMRLAYFLKVPVNYFFKYINDTNDLIAMVVAEEKGEKYIPDDKWVITEQEFVKLVKVFHKIEDPLSRKRIIELIRIMSC